MWQQAEHLLDRERPGDFNQGLMELGATVCTPRAPQCVACPLYSWCKSRGAEAVRPRASRKRKQLCYALARRGAAVLLVQRSANASLMAGMWELPTILESRRNASAPLARIRHSITDTDYEVWVIGLSPEKLPSFETDARWFSRKQWERLALTGLTRKVLRRVPVESRGKSAESNRRS